VPRAVTLVFRAVVPATSPRADTAAAFEQAGCTVRRAGEDDALLDPRQVLIVLANIGFLPKLRRKLLRTPPAARPFTVVWHSEPLPPPRASGLPAARRSLREMAKILLRHHRTSDARSNLSLLRQLSREGIPDLLVVTSLGRRDVLAENRLAAECVPLGYHPSHGRDLGLSRDIDVLFLGDLRVPSHRSGLRYLRRRGVEVSAMGSWSDPRYWNQSRTEIINRSKVFLNIQRNPGELPGFRFILGMANRSLVISEPTYRPDPYVPGKHYVSAALPDMPEAIRHYLRREDERRAIVDEAHRFVTEERTLAASAARIVGLIEERIGGRERIA